MFNILFSSRGFENVVFELCIVNVFLKEIFAILDPSLYDLSKYFLQSFVFNINKALTI